MTITPRRLTAGRAAAVLVVATLVASLTGPATADPRPDARRQATSPSSLRTPLHAHARLSTDAALRTHGRVDRSDRRALARRGVRLVECEAAPGGGYCGTLHVPLDRTNPARGTVRLFFLYYRHREPGPARSAIMLSEGGPGYSITNTEFEKQAYLDAFDPLMGHRDLVMIDQRGVGRSDVVKCPALQRDPAYWLPSILRKVAACARQLGDTATLYGSGDVALDMEAVRRALGVDKLDLYGASYAATGRAVVRRPVPPPRALGRPRLAGLGFGARQQGLGLRRLRHRPRPGGPGGGRPALRALDQLLGRAVGRAGGPGLAGRAAADEPGHRQRLRLRRRPPGRGGHRELARLDHPPVRRLRPDRAE